MKFPGQSSVARVQLSLLVCVIAAAAAASLMTGVSAAPQQSSAQPNILWITSEDNGPQIGAYGDAYATTPNIDALAARGFRYTTVWSNGPVCAVSRTALIAGMYPGSTGGEHMRSYVPLPAGMRLYPALLRESGYYTTNNSKTDYNYANVGTVWDESSNTAHYRNRKPGQPFFAIFNSTLSHESQIRTRPHKGVHDPAGAPVPPYMPDVREVREDWAQYYDKVTEMDRFVGERLAELDAAGLAEDTIVMYFGDHGSGMPRSKRFPYNSGLRVPLVVYVPPKFRHLAPPEAARPGSESSRLVSFVDFAPTLLSLAGKIPLPEWMQGSAFMGHHIAPAPRVLFGGRGRMDERYDFSRSVRDERYVYIRNYMPHRPWGQHVGYMFQTPTTAVWKRMYDAGELKPPQTRFWETKPFAELYDLQNDPWETNNLIGSESPAHAYAHGFLSGALESHLRRIVDLGFLPEYELHRGAAGSTPYQRAREPGRYNFDRIHDVANQASNTNVPLATIRPLLADADPVVRYWAAMGVVIRGAEAVQATSADLVRLLDDAEPGPRIMAAEALGRFGSAEDKERAMTLLLRDGDPVINGEFVALLAVSALNQIEALPEQVKKAVQALPATPADDGRKLRAREDYLPRLKEAIAADVR